MARNPVIRASAWSFGGLGGSQAVRLIGNLILTRLLVPETFGLMALVAILMQGLSMLSDVGIRGNIIRSDRGEDPEFIDTAWTIQVIRGAGIFVCICLLAHPFAQFYNEPRFTRVVPAVGLTALFAGFNSTSLIVANRRLWLGRATALNFGSRILSATVMITWAYVSPSVWALVAGNLTGSLATAVMSHALFPKWRNRFRWDKSAAREIVNFGRWIFLSSTLTFFAGQLDRLVLGKVVSLDLVGVYSIGFMWAQVPLQLVEAWSGSVFFPIAASDYRESGGGHGQAMAMRRKLNLACGAGVVILFAAAIPLFHLLYAPEYWGAAQIFQIILIGVWFRLLETTYGQVNLAHGTPAFITAGTGTAILVFLATFFPFYKLWGVEGIAAAYMVSQLALLFPCAYGARRASASDLRYDLAISVVIATLAWPLTLAVTFSSGIFAQ